MDHGVACSLTRALRDHAIAVKQQADLDGEEEKGTDDRQCERCLNDCLSLLVLNVNRGIALRNRSEAAEESFRRHHDCGTSITEEPVNVHVVGRPGIRIGGANDAVVFTFTK